MPSAQRATQSSIPSRASFDGTVRGRRLLPNFGDGTLATSLGFRALAQANASTATSGPALTHVVGAYVWSFPSFRVVYSSSSYITYGNGLRFQASVLAEIKKNVLPKDLLTSMRRVRVSVMQLQG